MNAHILRLCFPFVLFAAAFAPTIASACASCGCTLSSDWENSVADGLRMDLREDFIDQNQLRSGASTISGPAASRLINNGNPQEVEQNTDNTYVTLGVDYGINADWGVSVLVPYIQRSHSTLGTASDGVTGGDDGGQYNSDFSALGDVKLVGRYQGLMDSHRLGVLFGLKLPTGRTNLTGNSTDDGNPGPVSIDRGLQPGTGTTDLILGLSYVDSISKDWDYYTQALFQSALNSDNEYRPGDGWNLNLGLRYMGSSWWMPQVQLNGRFVQHDTGDQADTISTGGTLVYLSPGAVVPVGEKLSLYGFFQLPLYQYFEGVQLAPLWTFSLGIRYQF